MKRSMILGATAALLTLAGPIVAAETPEPTDRVAAAEHKFEKAKDYYTECSATEGAAFEEIRPYLKAFTDVEVMTATMADPVQTARLMAVVSDPRTIHVMMKCSTEPVMWDTWMRGLTDFEGMFRASLVFANPMTWLKWMAAPVNPQVYAAMFDMVSPGNLERWGTAMINPTFYEPMYEPLISLDWYTPRINWMLDPVSWEPLLSLVYEPQAAAE